MIHLPQLFSLRPTGERGMACKVNESGSAIESEANVWSRNAKAFTMHAEEGAREFCWV